MQPLASRGKMTAHACRNKSSEWGVGSDRFFLYNKKANVTGAREKRKAREAAGGAV